MVTIIREIDGKQNVLIVIHDEFLDVKSMSGRVDFTIRPNFIISASLYRR